MVWLKSVVNKQISWNVWYDYGLLMVVCPSSSCCYSLFIQSHHRICFLKVILKSDYLFIFVCVRFLFFSYYHVVIFQNFLHIQLWLKTWVQLVTRSFNLPQVKLSIKLQLTVFWNFWVILKIIQRVMRW